METTDETVLAMQPASVLRWARASVRAELDALAACVDALHRDAGFMAALELIARFWMYSSANRSLIVRACPQATKVMGQRSWAKLGRTICAGETPIQILAPARPRGFPFLLVPVYDVSQTEGRPLVRVDLSLEGETPHVGTLELAAARLGIAIRPTLRAGILGESRGGEIHVREDLPGTERVCVIAHELAHELLHQQGQGKRLPSSLREAEAEATAHVILRALALPSKAPGYIAWQGGDGAAIMHSLARIQRAACQILRAGGVGPKRRARSAAT